MCVCVCVVRQSVAVDTVVKAGEDGRGGRQNEGGNERHRVCPVSLFFPDQRLRTFMFCPRGFWVITVYGSERNGHDMAK